MAAIAAGAVPCKGAEQGWDHPTKSQRSIFSPFDVLSAWHQLYEQLAPF